LVLVFVEHDEDEGEPWAEVVKGRSRDLFGEDRVLDGEDCGAGDAEEEFVFFEVLYGNCNALA
jgi:hypothetical protein